MDSHHGFREDTPIAGAMALPRMRESISFHFNPWETELLQHEADLGW